MRVDTQNRQGSPRIAIVGVGALGCQVATSISASYAATLTLADFDRVERTNIRRQTLYDAATIGQPKAIAAAASLRRDFPASRPAIPVTERVTGHALARIVESHDLVVDATDDVATKFALNHECRSYGVPLVYGGATRARGLAMVVTPASTACLECVFPAHGEDAPDGCARAGVLAPVAGFVGALQAWLAIRVLTGDVGLLDRLFVYEAAPRRWQRMRVPRDPECRACENAAAHAA